MLFFVVFLIGPKLKQLEEKKHDIAFIALLFEDMLCGSYSMELHLVKVKKELFIQTCCLLILGLGSEQCLYAL